MRQTVLVEDDFAACTFDCIFSNEQMFDCDSTSASCLYDIGTCVCRYGTPKSHTNYTEASQHHVIGAYILWVLFCILELLVTFVRTLPSRLFDSVYSLVKPSQRSMVLFSHAVSKSSDCYSSHFLTE